MALESFTTAALEIVCLHFIWCPVLTTGSERRRGLELARRGEAP